MLATQLIVATIVAWAAVGLVVATIVTQAAGVTRLVPVAVLQALTPVLSAGTVLAMIVGRFADDWPLTIAGVLTTVAIAATVAPALRRPGRRRPAVDPPASALSVFHGNLLFQNVGDPPAVAAAVLATGADVLALSELHPDQERALDAHPLSARYVHRIGHSSRSADGLALWSTRPLADVRRAPHVYRDGLLATVEGDGGPVRILFAHPSPPTRRRYLREWEPALPAIGRIGSSPGPPTLIVADLNAARWHPPLRRLLRGGWRDAHEAAGRGLSTSWPTIGRFPVPFVRLDHALLGDGLDLVAVHDVTVPGSDHRAFVVTVTRST